MLATGWNEYDGDKFNDESQLIKFIKSKPKLQLIANPYAGSFIEMGDYDE
jgi:hypothetical protein